MARFKVKDIPKNQKISTDELKRIRGGAGYIKFDGVDGEAKADWIEVMSYRETGFSQGVSQPGGGATGPTRR